MSNRDVLPSVTVDAVVLSGSGEETALLVIERGKRPFKGAYALPGGFVEEGEPPIVALVRELSEETGLTLPYAAFTPMIARGMSGRDPRGWTITIPFFTYLDEVAKKKLPPLVANDDAVRAEWILLRDLEELAFDHGALLCESLAAFWPLGLAAYAVKTNHCRLYGVPNLEGMPELIFYGGSFRPWHRGHQACIDLLPPAKRSSVIVVPDQNPFKNLDHTSKCAWRFYQSILKQAQVLVYPGFCGLERKNPTAQWMESVQGFSCSLLMGDDCFAELPYWHDPVALLSKLQALYVVRRSAKAERLQEVEHWLRSDLAWKGQVHQLGPHAYQSYSSTQIRQGQGEPH